VSRGTFLLVFIGVVLLIGAFATGVLDFGYWRSRVGYQINSATSSLNPAPPRESPAQMRKNAATCRENLRRVELAKRKASAASGITKEDVAWSELLPHLGGKQPRCPTGGSYKIGSTTVFCKCSVSNNRTSEDSDDHILKAF
jgi:hypothetical protein